jgi:hypothetical protein
MRTESAAPPLVFQFVGTAQVSAPEHDDARDHAEDKRGSRVHSGTSSPDSTAEPPAQNTASLNRTGRLTVVPSPSRTDSGLTHEPAGPWPADRSPADREGHSTAEPPVSIPFRRPAPRRRRAFPYRMPLLGDIS